MPSRIESTQCQQWLNVHNPNPSVVLEREQCKNRTTHESGFCPRHRPTQSSKKE